MREHLSAALDRRKVDRPPCVSPGQTAIAELQRMTGASCPQAHLDAELMARLASSTVSLGRQEGARVPFETTLDATAFGAETAMGTPLKQPYVTRHPLPDREAVDQAVVPDPRTAGRAPVMLEAVRALSRGEAPVLCAVAAPFTLACFLHEERNTLSEMITDPLLVRDILSLAERWGSALIREALIAGADVIVIEDTWASGEILPPEMYADFALPGESALARAAKEAGSRSILQLCGHPGANLELMGTCGADGLVVHQDIDISEAREAISDECALIGNISPLAIARMSPREITELGGRCVDDGVDVLAPACGLDPATPLRNLQAIAEAVRLR